MTGLRNIIVAHSRPDTVSGAELAIADFVDKRQDELRYVMLTPGDGVLARYYRDKGYAVWARKLETKRRLYPGLHSVQSYFFARQFRRKKVHAVLANTFAAAARVKTACRLAGIPWAIYVREYISKKQLHRDILADATAVFAVSRDVAAYLSDMVSPEKISVVYDHINPDPLLRRIELHTARGARIVPYRQPAPVVGVIGRITKYKQQDLFLRSIPGILAEFPEARFVVVGSAGAKEQEYERSLKDLARALGIEEKVAFMGHRPDAVEIMSELSACCLTSDREPFPRTLLEAQLLGTPVVAADTGGCPEMVEDGVSGVLFSSVAADAPGQLASAVVRVLRTPALASELVRNARQRLLDGVASPKPVHLFEALLFRLIDATA